MHANDIKIEIRDLTMAYGSRVVMKDISARVRRGSVFVIMGTSGSGKSTLLRHLIGLQRPAQGDVFYDGKSFWNRDEDGRRAQLRNCGVLFQSSALWSSMTLAENVALPLIEYSAPPPTIMERLKLLIFSFTSTLLEVIVVPGGSVFTDDSALARIQIPGAPPTWRK